MVSVSRRRRCRHSRAGVCLIIAVIVALGSRSAGQQPAAPQTGAPRHLWPQRPGVFRPLRVEAPPPEIQLQQLQTVDDPEFVPNEVLVQFQPDVADEARAAVRMAAGASLESALRGQGRLERLRTSLPVADAIAILQAFPQVEFAEPNWIVRHYASSNDPFYVNGQLWGMYGNGTTPANEFGSQAGEVWERGFTGSSDVYVAVIDEGIDFNHPDLSANIWTNPFDPVDGIDNDANGMIDDVHGWDFRNEDNSIYDGSPAQPQIDDHGTHVSGTIGARGGNAEGVAGVNWNVTIIAAKFLEGTGSTFDAVEALEYITGLKQRHGLNIVATSNSWGGAGASTALHQAIIRAAKEGILFVAAAGNGGADGVGDDNDAVPHYPSNYSTLAAAGNESAANYEAVIAVAAITSSGGLSSFSNFGATSVDIGAPGSGIYSTTPQNGYSSFSGTSMATPHVTGAAALYKSMNPGASAVQIRDAIIAGAIDTASLAGKTVTGKRLNVGDFGWSPPLPALSINDVTVSEGNPGTSATFTVSLSTQSASTVSVNYTTADVTATASRVTRANTASMSIPSSGNSPLYPSTITVEPGLGTVTKVTATLIGFGHSWPSDVDILMVGPAGQKILLMSDVGSDRDAAGLTLTFDDRGAALAGDVVQGAVLRSGVYRPSNMDTTSDSFGSPAPAGPYGSSLAVFNDTDPAGAWQLFVRDDTGGDSGTIAGGWSITLETRTGDYVGRSGTLQFAPGVVQQPLPVVVNPDTIGEPAETFKVVLSHASGAAIADGQGVATIQDDDSPDAVIGSLIRATHIVNLRGDINTARVARGLGPYAFTDPSLTPQSTAVRAVHIMELRVALAEAYDAVSRPRPVYTDPVIMPGVTIVRAVHITEIQTALANLP